MLAPYSPRRHSLRHSLLVSLAKSLRWWFLPAFASALSVAAAAQQIGATRITPNLAGQLDRHLRYRPEGEDFVIRNGTETFNRPLYGGHTAFRIDGGDRPEFVLYLPGRGGNLRFAVETPAGAVWLHDAAEIETRYRPGELHYDVRDPRWAGSGRLQLSVVVSAETEQLLVRVRGDGLPRDARLWFAFGGVHGERGRRDGDIGTEAVPISTWFQLRPEFCAGNRVSLRKGGFAVDGKPGRIEGAADGTVEVAVADADDWADASRLIVDRPANAPMRPVVLGRFSFDSQPIHHLAFRFTSAAARDRDLAVYEEVSSAPTTVRASSDAEDAPPSVAVPSEDPATAFVSALGHFAALRGRVTVQSPDPFLDAAVGALNVAADALWDERQRAIMHGAIAWRTRLLGWRGPYSLDALGWHDRFRRHARYWVGRQNTEPIPLSVPPPEERTNLARNPAGLHTQGDFSNSHYDMNLVFIDALFRHLAWTGDAAFAREVWPAIERHLAWEKRLFRRDFTTPTGETLPLYEAYAAIWASDDLQYSGGGALHASAYNFFHRRQAAAWARRLGHDARPHEEEAAALARGMRELLWVTEAHPEVVAARPPYLTFETPGEARATPAPAPAASGWFAEHKDWLGLQRVHPAAALWTYYHAVDSQVPSAAEAYQLTDYVRRVLPHLPVRGPGVPPRETRAPDRGAPGLDPADLYTVGTSNWMPYDWSINNVVMGEAMHAALAAWQSGQPDEAWALAKGSLLAAMYLGISPGNVGSMSYLDVYRRESQRDFADGAGVLARALLEGLFGLVPAVADRELRLRPGWPQTWPAVTLTHPDVRLRFERSAEHDRYHLELLGALGPVERVRCTVRAWREDVAAVTVDGTPVTWRSQAEAVGEPWIEFSAPVGASRRAAIEIVWAGAALERVQPDRGATEFQTVRQGRMTWRVAPHHEGTGAGAAEPAGPPWVAAPARDAPFDPVDLSAVWNGRISDLFRREYRAPRSPFVSLAIPKQGIGGWAGGVERTAEIDDRGWRTAAAARGGRFVLPNGIPFATPVQSGARNVVFTSQWDLDPREVTVSMEGHARAVHLVLAGTSLPMHSRFEVGRVDVAYRDGAVTRLRLVNPETWWPIEQDFFTDDYQFRVATPRPLRIDLETGRVRDPNTEPPVVGGRVIRGGAATVLAIPLDPERELKSLTLKAIANDVVVGLMAATLER